MKKILFILMACFCITCVNAQDRIDEISYSFISESEIVSNITGWLYNGNEGKWIDNHNCIYYKKESYANDKRFSLGLNTVQIKSFNYNDDIKYVLIISFNGGHYRYRSIQEDWRSYTEYAVFNLTDEQYNYIVNPNEYTQFVTSCFTYDNYYEKRTDNWIIRQIISRYELKYLDKYKLAIKKYKDVIRFIYAEDKSYGHYDYTDDITMNKRYFEIPYNEWIKLKN